MAEDAACRMGVPLLARRESILLRFLVCGASVQVAGGPGIHAFIQTDRVRGESSPFKTTLHVEVPLQ